MSINIIDILNSATEGNIESELIIGVLFGIGYFGENPIKAFKWCKQAADKGSPLAQFILSGMLIDGKSTSANHIEALRYLQKAVDVGFMPATIRLAEWYGEGIGVNKNLKEKIKILRNAANDGNIQAALHLGHHFSDEDNGFLNYKEALTWFLKAESMGASNACFFIAGIYDDTKDFANALLYYDKACNSFDENACLVMAIYYSKGGLGLDKDDEKARKYSKRAREIKKKRTNSNEILFSFTSTRKTEP